MYRVAGTFGSFGQPEKVFTYYIHKKKTNHYKTNSFLV